MYENNYFLYQSLLVGGEFTNQKVTWEKRIAMSLKETNNIEEYEQKILTKLKNPTKCEALQTS